MLIIKKNTNPTVKFIDYNCMLYLLYVPKPWRANSFNQFIIVTRLEKFIAFTFPQKLKPVSWQFCSFYVLVKRRLDFVKKVWIGFPKISNITSSSRGEVWKSSF